MGGEEVKPRRPKKPRGRRARGTGSIFFNGKKDRWVGRKVVGRSPTGRTLYKEYSGRTQAEVVRKLAAATAPGPGTTVGGWAALWVASLQVRPATRSDYELSVSSFITPALGHLRVGEVTPSRVEGFAVWLGKKGLGVNTVRKVLAHARILFGAAVRDGLIDRNPVAVARKPKGKKKPIDPFPPDQLAEIAGTAARYSAGGVIAVLAGIGLRVGEAVGLDAADFDPAAGTISVRRTYSREFGVGPPKSAQSVRTIRIPALLAPVLQAAAAGRATGPLFATRTGRRQTKGLARRAWVLLLRSLGLPFRNLHQLRHSVATALISDGVPLGDVAAYLGDTVETVVKTYLHPAGTDPADSLDRLLGGLKVGVGAVVNPDCLKT